MTAPVCPPKLAIRDALPADSQAIDAFVSGHPDATPFHMTGWTRAVERGCRQRCRTLIAVDDEDRIAGVLPLTEVASALFGRALVSSAFAVGGGPLAAFPSVSNHLVEHAIMLAKDLGCATLELRGGTAPGEGWTVDDKSYLGFVRNLAPDDASELLAIPRKQRAEVRRALGLGLEVLVGADPRDRTDHYAVYAESVRNLGTPVFPKALFDDVLDGFGEDADILTVRHNGRPVASVLSLYWRGTVMPYWGGGTRDARMLRANDLMYFALMGHARSLKGCTRFDFGRSKAGSGPASFKRNWGFEGEPLVYASCTLDGSRPRDINPLSARYRMQVALWKKLPLPIANRIGPLVSRGLG
jgi:FemAB-related protein (PEP-CTERM system-associated)